MRYILALLFVLGLTVSAHAAPTCEQLNEAWPRYHQRTMIIGWENKPFPCPSEEANVAAAFYYLENIRMIDANGREVFDYFEYVMEELKLVMRADRASASSATLEAISIGSSIFETHDADGNLLNLVGIEGALVLVHERKHMDFNSEEKLFNVKHVKCKPTDRYKDCGAKFHSLHNGEADIGDLDVDAYSVSVAYLTDVLIHGKGPEFSRSSAIYNLRYILNERFLPSGITTKQRADAMRLVGIE